MIETIPYRAWCNLCGMGFCSIDELQEHNKKELQKHREILSKPCSGVAVKTTEPTKKEKKDGS